MFPEQKETCCEIRALKLCLKNDDHIRVSRCNTVDHDWCGRLCFHSKSGAIYLGLALLLYLFFGVLYDSSFLLAFYHTRRLDAVMVLIT